MPMVRESGTSIDDLVACLPTSFSCWGGHVDTGGSSGARSSFTINAPFDGIIKITAQGYYQGGERHTGYGGGSITYGGVAYSTVGQEIAITEGQPITFGAYASDAQWWDNVTGYINWQWIV